MLQLEAQMGQIADDLLRGIDRHLLGSGHAHLRVLEHADHLFNAVFARQSISALQHADVLFGLLEEEVDG